MTGTIARAALAALLGICLAGCTKDLGEGDFGYVEGKVTDESGPVRGATVVAMRVDTTGQMTEISAEAATTDAEGRYRLDIRLEGESAWVNALVVAEAYGSALVSDVIEKGKSVKAAPITKETTVEAAAFGAAREAGSCCDAPGTTAAALRAAISAEIAAAVSGGSAFDADAAALAGSVPLALETSWAALTTLGVAAASIEGMLSAQAEAQVTLDATLDAAAPQAEVDAALAAYVSAVASARAALGLDVKTEARVAQATNIAAVLDAAALSAAAQAQVRLEAERARAEAAIASTASAFATLQAGTSVTSAVDQAAADLRAAITASAGAEAAIDPAWSAWAATVEAQLELAVEARAVGGGAAVDSVHASLASTRATLDASLSTAADAVAIATAYAAFFVAVESACSGNLILSGLPPAELAATAEVLVHANLD